MRILLVSLLFFTAYAFPSDYQKDVKLSDSGHARKRSFNHGTAVFGSTKFYNGPSFHLAPAGVFVPSPAVSHQSREDVHTSETLLSVSPVASPVLVQVYQAPSVYTVPVQSHLGGSAVSHQTRVDSKSSSVVLAPLVVESQPILHSVVKDTPVVDFDSVYTSSASSSLYQPNAYAVAW
ncbi:hypothetical protein KGM_201128 [Danaus plexippus plexippus]|uniref:Uncharacterized protein n=1 Tax=Danaus plexippus plexippus TaxID=278856 RepID=A0A212FK60_DANPL|nr:hypothetical protein KGM_201128 [Danaus plexippus plexippus]